MIHQEKGHVGRQEKLHPMILRTAVGPLSTTMFMTIAGEREWKFPLVEPNHAPSGHQCQRKPHQETSNVVWIIPQSAFQMLLHQINDNGLL